MWRVISTAVRSISLAGWTRLYSQPPGRLFVWTMWRIHIIHVLGSPDKDSISQRSPALHHVTPKHWSYWCLKWQYDGENTEMIEPPSVFHWRPQGCSCGLCLKTQQLFTPHSPMSCLFSWLIVFSLFRSSLNSAVRFIHQTFNQMWSLPKQLIRLWGFCTQGNCKTCFSNCSENITYEIQNGCVSGKMNRERWIDSFISCDRFDKAVQVPSEITFTAHLALILYG